MNRGSLDAFGPDDVARSIACFNQDSYLKYAFAFYRPAQVSSGIVFIHDVRKDKYS